MVIKLEDKKSSQIVLSFAALAFSQNLFEDMQRVFDDREVWCHSWMIISHKTISHEKAMAI